MRHVFLNLGLGRRIAMPQNKDVRVQRRNAFGGGNPAFRRSVLFQMDQGSGRLVIKSPVKAIFCSGR